MDTQTTEFEPEFNADYNRWNFMQPFRQMVEVVKNGENLELVKHENTKWKHEGQTRIVCSNPLCDICSK